MSILLITPEMSSFQRTHHFVQWLLHLQWLSAPITNLFSARQPLLQAYAPFCPLKPICPTEFYSEALHPGLNSHILALSTSSKPAIEQVFFLQSGLKGSQFLRTALKKGLPLSQQPTAQPVSGREGAGFSDSPLGRWRLQGCQSQFPSASSTVSKRVYCCSMSVYYRDVRCLPDYWVVYIGSV